MCGTGIVIDIPTIQKRESGQGQVIGHLEIKVRELQGHILTGLHGIEQEFFAVIPVDPAIGNGVQLPGSVSFGVQQLSMGQLLHGPVDGGHGIVEPLAELMGIGFRDFIEQQIDENHLSRNGELFAVRLDGSLDLGQVHQKLRNVHLLLQDQEGDTCLDQGVALGQPQILKHQHRHQAGVFFDLGALLFQCGDIDFNGISGPCQDIRIRTHLKAEQLILICQIHGQGIIGMIFFQKHGGTEHGAEILRQSFHSISSFLRCIISLLMR